MKQITALALAGLMGLTAAPALAQSQGDFTVGLGLGWIEPDSGSRTALPGGKISAEGALSPTFTFEYFVADNIGIELLASWPFKHDLELGGNKIGATKHLPPTLSVQYHFTNTSQFTPFVGVGVNSPISSTRRSTGRVRPRSIWTSPGASPSMRGSTVRSAKRARCAPMCGISTSRPT